MCAAAIFGKPFMMSPAGRQSLAPEVRDLLEEDKNTIPVFVEPLTARELEVLHLVVQGVRNGEIAQRLFISVKTVETHLTSLYGTFTATKTRDM